MKYDFVNDVDETVKNYFNSLKNYKALSKKEEHELIRDYRNNHNINARNRLINSNLKYACKLASSFRNRGISYSDLISEANNGLIEAIDKFDLSKDVKLISYSKWWIIQKMQNILEKESRMPETDLPDERQSIEIDDDNSVMDDSQAYSYDNTFMTDSEIDEDERDKSEYVENIMRILDDRECDMINMYFGRCGYNELTLDEIGKKYNLTKERVRQIIETALKKLRSQSMLVGSKYLSR